ncbi:hypothetical protein RN001_005692 [Aquatica leii]|uniref:Regulatory protein zeste n=1 Tax=Aquatica leii TaxID=1421715 RepID=A0AAN7SPX8_9COLE|nr:hypothetical protein RN001_005692 [Aquatica leii]
MNNKRVRGKNFTEEESLELLSLTAPFKKILENKQTNAVTNQEKAAAWQSIKEQYDAAHPLQMRTTQQLTAKYENLKTQARKYAADNKRIVCGTGGGNDKYIKDVVLEAVLELLNKTTVYGEDNNFDDDFVMTVPEENLLAEPVNHNEIDAELVGDISEMEVIFNTPSTSQRFPPNPTCDLSNTVPAEIPLKNKSKFLKKRKGTSELHVLADPKVKCIKKKQGQPVLYVTKLKEYKNKNKRAEAVKYIQEQLKEKYPFLTTSLLLKVALSNSDVVKKIHILRTQYLKEVGVWKKFLVSGAPAEAYKPKLWCFDALNFLSEGDPVRDSMSNFELTQITEPDVLDEENEVLFEGTVKELSNVDLPTTSGSSVASSDSDVPKSRKRVDSTTVNNSASVAALLNCAVNTLEEHRKRQKIEPEDELHTFGRRGFSFSQAMDMLEEDDYLLANVDEIFVEPPDPNVDTDEDSDDDDEGGMVCNLNDEKTWHLYPCTGFRNNIYGSFREASKKSIKATVTSDLEFHSDSTNIFMSSKKRKIFRKTMSFSSVEEDKDSILPNYPQLKKAKELVVTIPKLDVIPQQRVPLDAPILTTAVIDVERTRTDTNNTQIIIHLFILLFLTEYLEQIIRKKNILQSTIVDIN